MAKIAGKDLVFKIGSPLTSIGIFDPSMEESTEEIDVTDSESSAREYITGFVNRTISFSKWFADDETPLSIGDVKDFSWQIGNKTITGKLIITGRNLSASREDAHRYNYTARINGDITIS